MTLMFVETAVLCNTLPKTTAEYMLQKMRRIRKDLNSLKLLGYSYSSWFIQGMYTFPENPQYITYSLKRNYEASFLAKTTLQSNHTLLLNTLHLQELEYLLLWSLVTHTFVHKTVIIFLKPKKSFALMYH